MAGNAITPGAKGIFLVVCSLAALLLLGLLAVPPSRPDAKWRLARGAIGETRIVPERAIETRWGSQLKWKAEYKVIYSVASREYTVWADSGVRGESEAEVRVLLPKLPRQCLVLYDLKKPEAGLASCRSDVYPGP